MCIASGENARKTILSLRYEDELRASVSKNSKRGVYGQTVEWVSRAVARH